MEDFREVGFLAFDATREGELGAEKWTASVLALACSFAASTISSSSPSASSLPFDILLGWIRIRVCCQPSFLCYLPFFVPYLPPSYICTAIPHHCSASIDLIPHIRTPHPSLLYNLPANERIESVLDLDMGDWCLRLQQGHKKELLLHGSCWWVRVYSRMPILR